MTAATLASQSIATPLSADNKAWGQHDGCGGVSAHSMKLLDSAKIRTLILRKNVEVLPRSSTRRPLEQIGPESNDAHNDVTNSTRKDSGVDIDPSEVRRLLALDIEELMRHTFRVQRERSNNLAIKSGELAWGSGSRALTSSYRRDQASVNSRQTKGSTNNRRKRRRAASGSLSPPSNEWTRSKNHSTGGNSNARDVSYFRARSLNIGLASSDMERMEAALRSAEHETRLLRARLGQVLGCDLGGPLSISAARAAADFVLAETSAHRDIDKENALLRSSATFPLAPVGPSAAPQQNGDSMEVDDEAVIAAGSEMDVVIDRARLLSILAADNRLSTMADHLGSAEPIVLSQIMPASLNQLQSATDRKQQVIIAKPEEVAISKVSSEAEGIQRSVVSRRFPGKGEDRRSRSAEDTPNSHPLPICGALASRAAGGLNSGVYGGKKRSRTSGDEEDERPVGGNDVLGRSSSFAFGQQDHRRVRSKEEVAPCSSLPKLKVSRLDRGSSARDEFDQFGGRETPHILRRGSLAGGGEDTQEAIHELRRQLDITKNGLVDLKARVRADVAWVQETVGARMSRRTRVSCCKWGAEKIAELSSRREKRLLGKAMTTWISHRRYMANKETARIFLKRRGAAQIRRLLDVWGSRLTKRALEEWQRSARLQRKEEETAAAGVLQTIARGFLGRRIFRHALEMVSAKRIQKVARGKAGRGKAARFADFVKTRAAANKIQIQTRKRGERRRAQRIVALKRKRRAAIRIQKRVRGFFGHRKAVVVREERVRRLQSTKIQSAWRGLQGRRSAESTRIEVETTRTLHNAAAVQIQAAQRKKAAKEIVGTKRRMKALQRRTSAEFAAVSIQRVGRGRSTRMEAARAAAEAATRREEKQRAAAAIHIQRMSRGREARNRVAAIKISCETPLLASRPTSPGKSAFDENMASNKGEKAEPNANNDAHVQGGASIFEPGLVEGDGGSKGGQDVQETDGRNSLRSNKVEQGTAVETREINHDEDDTGASVFEAMSPGSSKPSTDACPKKEMVDRAKAASKIQAVRRGRAARADARCRQLKRKEEETRRAKVWGGDHARIEDSKQDDSASARVANHAGGGGTDRHGKHEKRKQKEGQAVVLIQAAFRGGRARHEATSRRAGRREKDAEALIRAKDKKERAAAIKIQTRARGMSAKRQRARHATRVDSIRDSGRAAADDLRALSRPSTAAEAFVVGATSRRMLSGPLDTSSSSGGRRSHTAGGSSTTVFGGDRDGVGGMLEMAAAIALADIRPPPTSASRVEAQGGEQRAPSGGRSSISAGGGRKRVAAGCLTSPSRGSQSVVVPQPRASRLQSTVSTLDRSGGGRKPSSPARATASVRRPLSSTSSKAFSPQRDRKPSSHRSRSSNAAINIAMGGDTIVDGEGRPSSASGVAVGQWTTEDLEQMQRDMRRGLEHDIHRGLTTKLTAELAAKMAVQEEERGRALREAEETRRRDREALEETMRSVRKAHSKDAVEIAFIKARLKEEEVARRAEHDAARKEYEQRLADVRAQALLEAEKGRKASEDVEALRRKMEEEVEMRKKQAAVAEAERLEREAKKKAVMLEKEAQKDEESKEKCQNKGVGGVEEDERENGKMKEAGEETLSEEKDAVMHVHTAERGVLSKGGHRVTNQEQREYDLNVIKQNNIMQQLAAEAAERQRVALQQLQVQLLEEEAKRLESHAAWEARQAEEEVLAKEERQAELEVIESLKRQLEEEKVRAGQEQELRNAELKVQIANLRSLQDKAEEQDRLRLEAERAAKAEERAKEAAIVEAGAKLMQDDDLDDGDSDQERHGQYERPTTSPGIRPVMSRPNTREVDPQVEEVVKREIEAVTGTRLAQVEGALLELSKKQAELEKRERDLVETRKAVAAATRGPSIAEGNISQASSTSIVATQHITANGDTAVVPVADEECMPDPERKTGGEVVSSGGAAGAGGGGGGQEWVEYWDESAGASYFFNTVTQEASWTNPHEGAESPGAGGVVITGGATVVGKGANNGDAVSQSEDGRAKWTECLDEVSGATYYYNVITGEAEWEKPAELSPKAAGGAQQFENPEDWVCFLDETSGEEYWFNLTNGETRWAGT